MDSKWESLNLVLNEHHHLCQKIWFPLPRLRLEHCPDLPLLFPTTGTLSLHICLAFVEDKEIKCPNFLSFGFGSYSSNCSRKSVHGWTDRTVPYVLLWTAIPESQQALINPLSLRTGR
ncbi:hypothetical protein BDL97_10G007800 [Sphagnum fallax]|nr:hypothetical protein BDL97_10G007800 [Sphagnum fallax]